MAQFNRRCSSVPDAAYKLAPQQKVCAASIQERIAALEWNLSGAVTTSSSSHTPKPDFEKRFLATLPQSLAPSSLRVQSFKPAETQRGTGSPGSSIPSHPRTVTMTHAVKRNTDVSNKASVSLASAKPVLMNYSRPESTNIWKPETQKTNIPSKVPKVHQCTKLSLAQQSTVTKEQSSTISDDGMENIISAKPAKLPQRQKPTYIRTSGTQNKLQWKSPKPSVPKKSLPGVLAVGLPPPKPNRPPSVDLHRFGRNIKSLNDGTGMKKPCPAAPPPTPLPLHLCPSSNHATALSRQLDKDDSYDDVGIINPPPLPNEVHPSKRTNNNKVTEEKQTIKEPVHVTTKGKAPVDFKGGKSDLSPSQEEIIHNTGNSEGQWLARNLEVGEDDVYDDVDNSDTRLSPLPQPTTDGNGVYANLDFQSPPLSFDGYDIYVEVKEDCIYENGLAYNKN